MPAPAVSAAAVPLAVTSAQYAADALDPATRAKNRYTRKLMKRVASGGDLVSDVDRRRFKEMSQEVAETGLKAQQMQLGQAAKAAAGSGPFMEQQFQTGAQKIAQAQADAAIKASGKQAEFEQLLTEKRTEQAFNLAEAKRANAEERMRMAATATSWLSKMPDDFLASLWDATGSVEEAVVETPAATV